MRLIVHRNPATLKTKRHFKDIEYKQTNKLTWIIDTILRTEPKQNTFVHTVLFLKHRTKYHSRLFFCAVVKRIQFYRYKSCHESTFLTIQTTFLFIYKLGEILILYTKIETTKISSIFYIFFLVRTIRF